MNVSNKEKWENTLYLENAVSCIRSLMFLSVHKDECEPIYSEDEIVDEKYKTFILALSYILDEFCKMNYKQGKKNTKRFLYTMYPFIQRIYYERDKNVAHKDRDYKTTSFHNLEERINMMKNMINSVRNACSEVLSDKYNIEYFPYDEKLRFCVFQITKDTIIKYRQVASRFFIGLHEAYLKEMLGININMPGDVCEIATKFVLFQIQYNIDNNTDKWGDVYCEMKQPYESFYNEILPKMKDALI